MPIVTEGNKVTVTEIDLFHRTLTWVYDGKFYTRTSTADLERGYGEHIKPVSELCFAGAFWREYRRVMEGQ